MKRRYYRRKKGIAKKEQPFFKESSSSIQTKEEKRPFFQSKASEGLTVGKPGDKYEVEADAMADAVMSNTPKSAEIQRKEITGIQRAEEEEVQAKIQRQAVEEEPAVQTQGAEEEEVQMQSEEEEVQMQAEEEEVQMQAEEEEVQMQAEEEEEVQAKSEEEEVQMQTEEEEPAIQAKAQGKPKANTNLSNRIKQSSGNGKPLSPKTKQHMEGAFGTDFSSVNIHTNSDAVQMNQELHAQAFAHGNDVYFNKGKYQPETSKGQHLLAHELTHVVQQSDGQKKKQVQPKLVYGGGYKGFSSTAVEVGKAKSGGWNPTTKDFKANASRSGGGNSAKNLSGLLAILKKAPTGSVKKLDLIGHSNSKALGLGGDVHSPGVPLTGVISASTLISKKSQINAIKDRFSDDAVITLYSCNSGGSGGGLLDAVSTAFGVCAKGFSNSVFWCITWNDTPLKITSRGNVFYADPNDPLGEIHPDCSSFNKSVHDLSPDIESCKGVQKKGDKKCELPEALLPAQDLFQPISFQFSEINSRDANLPQAPSGLMGLKFGDGMEHSSSVLRPRVKELQGALNSHGADVQKDGMFGNNTLRFLQQLQRRMGIPRGNSIGELTATALGLDPSILGKTAMISQIEGLKRGDGLIWGTWHLRPQVKKLQMLLSLHGFVTNADGMFGPNTEKALNAFQASQDISISKNVDGVTADRLEGRNITLCPFGEIPAMMA